MRCLLWWAWNALVAASLVLLVAVAVLWVRSYGVADRWVWEQPGGEAGVRVSRGRVAAWLSDYSAVRRNPEPGFRYSFSSPADRAAPQPERPWPRSDFAFRGPTPADPSR